MYDIKTDEAYMQQAIALAKGGWGHVEPNPLVGCVIVKDDKIIGKGFHAKYGDLHAEAAAIKSAWDATRGATLYVNLEPCNHQGKQPSCVEAIIEANIGRVVVGMQDANPKMRGKSISLLRRAGIQVTERILTPECEKLNESYRYFLRTGMPFVTYKFAMTVDGHQSIGRKTLLKNERHLTGATSDTYVQELRHRNSALIIGAETVRTDDPLLTDRSDLKPTSHPLRVIIGHHASSLFHTKILETAKDVPTIFATTDKGANLQILENAGIAIWRYPSDHVPVEAVLGDLGKRGVQSVLLEGGRRTASEFLSNNLVQKIEAFIAPRILAKGVGLGFYTQDEMASMARAHFLSDMDVRMSGEDIHITAYL